MGKELENVKEEELGSDILDDDESRLNDLLGPVPEEPEEEPEIEPEPEVDPEPEPEPVVDEKAADDDVVPPKPGEEEDKSGEQDDKKDDSTFEDQIANLEKSKAGVLAAKVAETKKRQDIEKELAVMSAKNDQFQKTVSDILAKREELRADAEPATEASKIILDIDDDGNASLPEDIIANLVQKAMNPTAEELRSKNAALEDRLNRKDIVSAHELAVNKVVSEDPDFSVAQKNLNTMVNWVADLAINYQEANNLSPPKDAIEAIARLEGTEVEDAFNEQFPYLRMAVIVLSRTTNGNLRHALKSISKLNKAAAPEPKEENTKETQDKKIRLARKLASKPADLGSLQNTKTQNLSIDQLSRLTASDILDLDDAAIAGLMAAQKV